MDIKLKNPKAVFVTGTDTEVGKTVVSGLMGRFLLENKYKVITQKWVQTGAIGLSQDIIQHLKLMGIDKENLIDFLPYMNPYTFKFTASPHLSAALELKNINKNKIKRSFEILAKKFDFVIVEGTGGVMVPFNKKDLLIDIAGELNLPVLIVVGNKLGAINHTLLTIEAVRKRQLRIIGLIFNNLLQKENRIILEDNLRIIQTLGNEKILGTLPFIKNTQDLYKVFTSIGGNFLSQILLMQNLGLSEFKRRI